MDKGVVEEIEQMAKVNLALAANIVFLINFIKKGESHSLIEVDGMPNEVFELRDLIESMKEECSKVDVGMVIFEEELKKERESKKDKESVDPDETELLKHIEEFTAKRSNMSVNFSGTHGIEGIMINPDKICIYVRKPNL